MNKEEWEDYKKLSGTITEKLDNTSTYESWLIIQEYIDRQQQENKQLKDKLNQITKRIRKAIDSDEDYLLEVLFDIQDIIQDEKEQKLQYDIYIKPYIEGVDK